MYTIPQDPNKNNVKKNESKYTIIQYDKLDISANNKSEIQY